MKFSLFFILLFTIFFTGCGQKKLTIKTLYPGEVNEKINSIKIENFISDDINQKKYIEEKIVNKHIYGKKVFTIKENYNVDAILKGEVLESSYDYRVYYKEKIDYKKCRKYKYDEKSKKKTCISYKIKRIPCEYTDYIVSTSIKLIENQNKNIIFNKIYTKTHSDDVCFNHRRFYMPHRYSIEDSRIINQLAENISQEVINDISPHYVNFNIPIMDELDDEVIKYSENEKIEFNRIVELLENKTISKAKKALEKFDSKSVEAMYNLALIYEYENQLENAHKLYKKALTLTNNHEYQDLINQSIFRTKINLRKKSMQNHCYDK